jgi:hypothetical protein
VGHVVWASLWFLVPRPSVESWGALFKKKNIKVKPDM